MALSQWVEIVEAAGFDARSMEAIDAFILAGRILRDPAVRALRLAAREGVFIGDTVPALKKMTPNDLAELRKRVKTT